MPKFTGDMAKFLKDGVIRKAILEGDASYFIPPGEGFEYYGDSVPDGYLLANGAAVSRETYADLFAVIGTKHGAGDGSTTFNLPDHRGRVGVGYNSADTDFDALGKTGGEKKHTMTLAEMVRHTVSLTTGTESADHAHTVSANWATAGAGNHTHRPNSGGDFLTNGAGAAASVNTSGAGYSLDTATWSGDHAHGVAFSVWSAGRGTAHTHTGTSAAVGSTTPFNVMQPYVVCNYIIKY